MAYENLNVKRFKSEVGKIGDVEIDGGALTGVTTIDGLPLGGWIGPFGTDEIVVGTGNTAPDPVVQGGYVRTIAGGVYTGFLFRTLSSAVGIVYDTVSQILATQIADKDNANNKTTTTMTPTEIILRTYEDDGGDPGVAVIKKSLTLSNVDPNGIFFVGGPVSQDVTPDLDADNKQFATTDWVRVIVPQTITVPAFLFPNAVLVNQPLVFSVNWNNTGVQYASSGTASFHCANPGTYTFNLNMGKGSFIGTATLTINGDDQATTYDGYAGASGAAFWTVTGITLVPGTNTISLRSDSKNVLASNYYVTGDAQITFIKQ